MSNQKRPEMSEIDPLIAEIRKAKAADPAPQLSGVAKAAIVQAAEANARASSPRVLSSLAAVLASLTDRLSGGLEVLLRPVAVGTLGLAGLAGLAAGGLLAAPAYAELTPEEELASHYEFALSGGIYNDQTTDGVN